MSIELKIPEVGESITEVEIGGWLKGQGDRVQKDEPVVSLESDKATVELPAPDSGTITQVLKKKGETAKVGEVIAYLDTGDGKPEPEKEATKEEGPTNESSRGPRSEVRAEKAEDRERKPKSKNGEAKAQATKAAE